MRRAYVNSDRSVRARVIGLMTAESAIVEWSGVRFVDGYPGIPSQMTRGVCGSVVSCRSGRPQAHLGIF